MWLTDPEQKRTLRNVSRTQAAIGALFFVNGAVVGGWVPFIPERAHVLSLGAGALGFTLLGGGLGAVIAMPLAGALIPRLGSRLVSTAGGVALSLMLLLAAVAPTPHLLFLALIGFGLSGAALDVAMNAQAVLTEQRYGRRILSSLHGAYSMGNVAGSLGVSLAFARHAPQRLTAMLAFVVLALAVLATVPFLLKEDVIETGRTERKFARRLVLLGCLVVAAMMSEGATADWSGVYLRNVRGLGPGWAGVGFGVFSAAMLCARLLGDFIIDRLGEVKALRVGGLVSACGALLVIFAPGRLGAMLGFALLGAGLANASPVLYRAAGQVPNLLPGVGLATAVGMGYASLMAGPPLLGSVAQALGMRTIFLVLAALSLLLCLTAKLAAPSAPQEK